MNDHDVRVMTRGGRMTQEPLHPEGHPKTIEQDSQRRIIILCILLVNSG